MAVEMYEIVLIVFKYYQAAIEFNQKRSVLLVKRAVQMYKTVLFKYYQAVIEFNQKRSVSNK